jgi:hypothetical protein
MRLERLREHSSELMFAAGFLFDLLTMQRIDAWTDLAIQLAYLLGLTLLLVYQQRDATGVWAPGRFAQRWWRYNVEALHFLYGGLLSAYVVLYLRSSTLARPAIFLMLLVGVMVVNEFPRVRRAGYRLRLGLYSFCVLSFFTYFIPVLIGRIGGWIFLLSLAASAAIVWRVTGWLTPRERREAPGPLDANAAVRADANAAVPADANPAVPARRAARWRLFAPAAAVLVFVGVLYLLRLIPPVPLSVQFQGIYHEVRRDQNGYTLVYEEPPPWAVWRRDSRPFERRAGDRLHYFARVFAPDRFRHRVMIRWEVFNPSSAAWITTDRIPLEIVGGRAEGFRGTAIKSNFMPGRWRVTAETEDGRALATLTFRVEDDTSNGERRWKTVRA